MNSDSHGPSRILLVDDHPVLRRGVRSLVEGESDLEVCAEVSSAREAIAAFAELEPDLAIIDVALKGTDGLDLVKTAKVRWPRMRVLVLSMMSERLYAELALRAGARGYLMKAEAPETLIVAIRRILEGSVYLSDELQMQWLERAVGGQPGGAFQLPIETLTQRELAILRLLGAGQTARKIAEHLHLSPKTVETHRDNIRNKLGLGGAAEVLQYAALWLEHAAGGEEQ